MPRTEQEHELVIDVLDDLLTFSYAYESEVVAGPALARLAALAREVVSQLAQGRNTLLFQDGREQESAVIQVMNLLKAARAAEFPREKATFADAWMNKPPVLAGMELRVVHATRLRDLQVLLGGVVRRLDAYPEEGKPFISREQVREALLATFPTIAACADLPIHVDTFVALVHQRFLAGLAADPTVVAWDVIVEEYTHRAERALPDMLRKTFLDDMVDQLLPAAKDLEIGIDRHYPWGALWREPLSAKELLREYARLNLSRAVADKKFDASRSNVDVPRHAFEFLHSCGARLRPAHLGDAAARQLYFNTDATEIRIGGKPVQKHAVMAIPYDIPVQDVEEKVGRFSTYILHHRRRYCAIGRQRLAGEENAAARRLDQEAMLQRKVQRTVLHDTSSVLGHLCALMWLQRRRSAGCPPMAIKEHHITIQEAVRKAGFTYGMESVRKACARADQQMAAVRQALAGTTRR